MEQPKNRGFITIQSIVDDVNLDIENYSEIGYKRMIRWAVRIVDSLSLTTIKKRTIKKVAVNKKTNTIKIPNDYISLNSVGFIMNGRYYRYTRNNTIVASSNDIIQDVDDVKNMSTNIDEVLFYENDSKTEIIIQGLNVDSVYLSYKCTGLGTDGKSLIPMSLREVIIAGIKYMQKADNDKIPLYTKRDLERKFDDAKRKFLAQQTPNVQTINTIF